MALTDSLFEYWKMDEAAAGTRAGAHGGLTLSENGGSIAAGTGLVYANAADVESGSSQFLSRTDEPAVSTGDIDWTVAVFFNAESLPGDGANMSLVNKLGAVTFEYDLLIAGVGATQILSFNFYGGGSFSFVNDATDLATGTWYCAFASHDAAANLIHVQLNTGADNSAASLGVGVDTADPFRIGGRASTLFFDGVIGPVIFWKRLLTSDERVQVWNGGLGLRYEDFNVEILSVRLDEADLGGSVF